MKAIRVERPGGPEVLKLQDVPLPEPGPGQARVRIHHIGVNYIDIYHRTGLYPLDLPFTPGSEAAGVVDAVGEGVTEVKVGDRVAYAMHRGSYAEYAVVPAWILAPLPDEISFETAAAVMLQGLTAHYLTHSTFPIQPGHKVLVHAAAGGVGLLLVQMAKARGATVFGTVSTQAKAELAKAAGADEVILYTQEDFAEAIQTITGGEGLDCVYDSVGKDTFEKSLKCLRPRGYLVLFGQSSGPVPPVDLQILNSYGSLYVTRPSLAHYILDREELLQRTNDLFTWIKEKRLDVRIDSTFPLAQAAEAHKRLESRASSGKILLEA
ncbi:MAG TPA: quinone oxidoreductase [Limnochordia bacterium]|nr:quinone oxidoreductase [Limnochordia bacterium]